MLKMRKNVTIRTLSARFLAERQGKVKPSTFSCYQRSVRCHILPALGGCVASELTAEDINGYLDTLLEELSPKTVREVGGLLLAMLRFAGFAPEGAVTLPKTRQRPIEVFTEPELRRIGQSILSAPNGMGLGVLLSAYTGLRLWEVCGLRWQDVDTEAGLLHVQQTVERITCTDGTTCLTVQTPKTDCSQRWVPIPDEMLRLLRRKPHRPEAYLLTGCAAIPDPRTCQYRYKALLTRCGVRYRSFHCLRHSYATRCVEQGVDVKSVSELLGHSDVRTTLRLYVHGSMDYKRKAVERIGFLGDMV